MLVGEGWVHTYIYVLRLKHCGALMDAIYCDDDMGAEHCLANTTTICLDSKVTRGGFNNIVSSFLLCASANKVFGCLSTTLWPDASI